MSGVDRRFLLKGLGAGLAVMAGSNAARCAISDQRNALTFGPAHFFSFDLLREQARALAARPYRSFVLPAAAIIQGIDFDKAQKIRFRPEDALWRGAPAAYPISLFHLNKNSGDPVTIFALEQTGTPQRMMARQIVYSSAYFDYAASGLDPRALGGWALPVSGPTTPRIVKATGWPFRAPAISALRDRTISMAPRPAASRSTPRWPRRKSFPVFQNSGWRKMARR